MKNESTSKLIDAIIEKIGELLPIYLQDPADMAISGGIAAVVLIEEDGTVNAKIFGESKLKGRDCFRVAWTKASQTWITGMKTGEFEKKIFSGELADTVYGISMPDMIGWMGGQPITLKDGTKLSAGFSGIRGENDLDIVVKAVAAVDTK